MHSASEHSSSGNGQDCSWVENHLGAYDLWDDSLSMDEFEVIETHLHHCPACAQRYEEIHAGREAIEMSLAGKSPKEWEQDKKDYGQHILAKLQDSGLFDEEVTEVVSPKTSNTSETQANTTKWRFVSLGTAVALVLFVALPVLAYVGSVLLQDAQNTTPASEGAEEIVLSQAEGVDTRQQALTEDEIVTAEIPSTELNITSEISLDQITHQAIIQAELDALLPNTEQEYEAWARKEYPHIMALYDILVYESDENLSTPQKQQQLASLIPKNLPDDIREALQTITNQASQQSTPLWDGHPANIPKWAQNLYKNTPEPERPTNWKALLIYSAEIFKFDYPETLDEVNCVPTMEAVERITNVTGTSEDLELLGIYDHLKAIPKEAPSDATLFISGNIALLKSQLIYIAISSSSIEQADFNAVDDEAKELIVQLSVLDDEKCGINNLTTKSSEVFIFLDNRSRLVERICDGGGSD